MLALDQTRNILSSHPEEAFSHKSRALLNGHMATHGAGSSQFWILDARRDLTKVRGTYGMGWERKKLARDVGSGQCRTAGPV